jgi:GMP synthase-like glutamine amidotransferase
LATSATCRQQAFRHGSSAWGVQFHPEITAGMVIDWLAEDEMCAEVASLDYIDPAEIRHRAPAALQSMGALSERIFSRFTAICRQRG